MRGFLRVVFGALCIPAAFAVLFTHQAKAPADDLPARITFSRDIASLMHNNCGLCHRPDGAGPFPLLSYQDVRKRAGQIADVLEAGTMPPWKPAADFGHFQDERRLAPSDIAKFRAWVDAGCLEGKPNDLPPAPEYR